MRVLELGCADGVSTFESGLADLIGERGQVIAIDPSMGMIFRANKRKAESGSNWVNFQQAKAERLPFHNESFDAVIALMEIKRVLKLNGEFTSLHPLKFKMNDIMGEWFSPIFSSQNTVETRLRKIF